MRRYLFEDQEHQALREQIRRFAAQEIASHAHAFDEAESFPIELYKTAAEAGLLGIGYPEEYDVSGGDVSHIHDAVEEMVLDSKSGGAIVGQGSYGIVIPPILAFGTHVQKEKFVRPMLAGEKI